jgi:hypothetical protein
MNTKGNTLCYPTGSNGLTTGLVCRRCQTPILPISFLNCDSDHIDTVIAVSRSMKRSRAMKSSIWGRREFTQTPRNRSGKARFLPSEHTHSRKAKERTLCEIQNRRNRMIPFLDSGSPEIPESEVGALARIMHALYGTICIIAGSRRNQPSVIFGTEDGIERTHVEESAPKRFFPTYCWSNNSQRRVETPNLDMTSKRTCNARRACTGRLDWPQFPIQYRGYYLSNPPFIPGIHLGIRRIFRACGTLQNLKVFRSIQMNIKPDFSNTF